MLNTTEYIVLYGMSCLLGVCILHYIVGSMFSINTYARPCAFPALSTFTWMVAVAFSTIVPGGGNPLVITAIVIYCVAIPSYITLFPLRNKIHIAGRSHCIVRAIFTNRLLFMGPILLCVTLVTAATVERYYGGESYTALVAFNATVILATPAFIHDYFVELVHISIYR